MAEHVGQMRIRAWLLLSILACGVSWLYMHRILGPWEYQREVAHGTLKAPMGDLYPRWVGTRELLLHGRNPYGPGVSHEIQMAYYGHAVTQQYDPVSGRPIDEQRFAYPVYIVLLLAPTVHLDFAAVQSSALILLLLMTAVSVLLWLEVLRWHPPRAVAAAITLFVLASPQVAQGLRLRQIGFVVSCLLALSAWCVRRNHLAAAGALLAFSTIKPQMVILPLLWFVIWAIAEWRKRWRLLAGFVATLAALVGGGEIILPGWVGYFLTGIAAYRRYFPVPSLLELALGRTVSLICAAMAVAGLMVYGWRNRKAAADSPDWTLTLAAFLIVSQLVLPMVFPFNQVLLILPVLMILRDWTTLPTPARVAFIVCISWPWIAGLALLLFPPDLGSPSRLPELPSFLVLLVPFLLPVLLLTRRGKSARTLPSPASPP
jgi:hypothetical protein